MENLFSIFIKFADFITYTILSLEKGTRLADSVHFFFYDVSKILFLLVFIIYIISLIRSGLDTDKLREYLAGKSRFVGYLIASSFGAITPFCSCSSIPLFLGFTSARIPVGITMAFLITSPIINEVALLLLGSLLGFKFMLSYLAIGITAGIIGGMFFDAIGAEKYLTPLGKTTSMPMAPAPGLMMAGAGGGGCCGSEAKTPAVVKTGFSAKHQFAMEESMSIVKKIWKWVFLGIAVGAVFHGFVPQEWIEGNLADGKWWSVPLASIVGIPLYADATSIVPIAESMLAKGMPLGTVLTFMMSVVGASFPEFILLKQVMQTKMLVMLFCLLLCIFTITGWIFNAFPIV
ncbi:MAG: permease [Desulfotalea sp.]